MRLVLNINDAGKWQWAIVNLVTGKTVMTDGKLYARKSKARAAATRAAKTMLARGV